MPEDDQRWLTLLDWVLGKLDEAGLDGTYWAAGEMWQNLTGQPLDNFTTDRPQMTVLTGHLGQ